MDRSQRSLHVSLVREKGKHEMPSCLNNQTSQNLMLLSSGRQLVQIPTDVNKATVLSRIKAKRALRNTVRRNPSLSELSFGQFVFLTGARGSKEKKNGSLAKQWTYKALEINKYCKQSGQKSLACKTHLSYARCSSLIS